MPERVLKILKHGSHNFDLQMVRIIASVPFASESATMIGSNLTLLSSHFVFHFDLFQLGEIHPVDVKYVLQCTQLKKT